jgi:hypothetical protein
VNIIQTLIIYASIQIPPPPSYFLTLVLFLFASLFFLGCKKTGDVIKKELPENISKQELLLWINSYQKLMPGGPKPILEQTLKTYYRGQMILKMPLSSGGGNLYFTKSDHLEVQFIRIVSADDQIKTPFNGYYEFINMNTYEYKKIIFKQGIRQAEVNKSLPKLQTIKNNSTIKSTETWLAAFIRCIAEHIIAIPMRDDEGNWGCYALGGNGDGTGSSPEVVQNINPGDSGADYTIQLLYWFLTNPPLDYTLPPVPNSFWEYYNGNTGGNNNWQFAPNLSYIDVECADPYELRAQFSALNIYYSLNPAIVDFGSLDETLEAFKGYKNQEQVLIPIIPMLIKAGANGAADAFLQALFIYLTEDDCPSFGAAFGHDKFSKAQVGRSAAEGLIPWRTPSGKLGRAGFSAVGDVLVNIVEGKYGEHNYQLMGQDFMLGFFSDLAGGAAGELASKYALTKIGKGLINKYGIHYKTATSWLGGGLQNINKTFNHTLSNGQTISITSSKIMKGWDTQKIAVIGRSQDERVIPFAQKLSLELGINVHQIKEWSGWSSNLTIEENKNWIKKLKAEGYTIYDIGPDYRYGNDFGNHYGMEHAEIFGN